MKETLPLFILAFVGLFGFVGSMFVWNLLAAGISLLVLAISAMSIPIE